VSYRTKIEIEPLDEWMFPKAESRVYSQFSASYEVTLDDLRRELDAVGAYRHGSAAVIQVVTPRRNLRRDGMLRAGTKIEVPEVALSFVSDHGPLTFHCDRYKVRSIAREGEPWQHNLRAIVKTMEALRAVERYGAVETGQQYRGFLAIENPSVTLSAARARLAEVGEVDLDGTGDKHLVQAARIKAHPDANHGNRHLWNEVQVLARALRVEK
jgi:hypothetical protein